MQNNSPRGTIISEVLAKGLADQTSGKCTKLDEKTWPGYLLCTWSVYQDAEQVMLLHF